MPSSFDNNNFIPPLIQRIALFCSADFKTPMKLALVNNSFREVIVDYSTALLCWNNLVLVDIAPRWTSRQRDNLVLTFDRLCNNRISSYLTRDSNDVLLQWVFPQVLQVTGEFRHKGHPILGRQSCSVFDHQQYPTEQSIRQNDFTFRCSPAELLVYAAQHFRTSAQKLFVDFVIEGYEKRQRESVCIHHHDEKPTPPSIADIIFNDLRALSSDSEAGDNNSTKRLKFLFCKIQNLHYYKSEYTLNLLDMIFRISQQTQHPEIFEGMLLPSTRQVTNGCNATLAMLLCGHGKVKVLESMLAKMTPEVFKRQLLFKKETGNQDTLFDCAFYHPGVCYFLVKLLLEKATSCDAIPLLFSSRSSSSSSGTSNKDESSSRHYLHHAVNKFVLNCASSIPESPMSVFPKEVISREREIELHDKTVILLLKYLSEYKLLKDEDLTEDDRYSSGAVQELFVYGSTGPCLIDLCIFKKKTKILMFAVSCFSSEEVFGKFLATRGRKNEDNYLMDEIKRNGYFEICVDWRKSLEDDGYF